MYYEAHGRRIQITVRKIKLVPMNYANDGNFIAAQSPGPVSGKREMREFFKFLSVFFLRPNANRPGL